MLVTPRHSASPSDVLSTPFSFLIRPRYAFEDAQELCLCIVLQSVDFDMSKWNRTDITESSPISLIVIDTVAMLLLEVTKSQDRDYESLRTAFGLVGKNVKSYRSGDLLAYLAYPSSREMLAHPQRRLISLEMASLRVADQRQAVYRIKYLFSGPGSITSQETGAWNYARKRQVLDLVKRT